jgi:CubicO group peptidase (beta-lactamase class C family)
MGAIRYLELSGDIRSAYQYNNLCYNVLGLLIERLSGQSYEAFIRARLIDRLGMTVSFTLDDLEASSEPARPYAVHEDTRLPAIRLAVGTIAAEAEPRELCAETLVDPASGHAPLPHPADAHLLPLYWRSARDTRLL